MAALIDVNDLREHIETDINNAALEALIDAADQEIVESLGEHSSTGTVSEQHIGGDKALFLNRPYESITSVTERRGTTTTVLADDDYRSWYGNRLLERLALEATNPQANWAEITTVVYTPVDDDASRIRATIDLVKLAVQFTGVKSERIGDYATTSHNESEERAKIIARLDRKSLIPG